MKFPQFTTRDLFWTTALIACGLYSTVQAERARYYAERFASDSALMQMESNACRIQSELLKIRFESSYREWIMLKLEHPDLFEAIKKDKPESPQFESGGLAP